jgi:hypothetical protein
MAKEDKQGERKVNEHNIEKIAGRDDGAARQNDRIEEGL